MLLLFSSVLFRIQQHLRLRQFLLLLCLSAGWSSLVQAHIQIELPADIKTAIQQKLAGPGVTISNVQIERWSGVAQVATFRNGTENTGAKPNIGIESGLVLSTGDASTLTWSTKDAFYDGSSFGVSTLEETDLAELLNTGDKYILDPVVITFELIPTTDNITIDFTFGSDEYEYYVHKSVVDVYGFFISGPGINGTFTDQAVNIAQFPSGDPVSTNYVNRDINSDYYIRNPDVTFYENWSSEDYRGNHVALNGWTKVTTSYLPVEIGKTYKVKIALADGGDGLYDSSVFIGQFKSIRQLGGRVFKHRTGSVDEKALAEGNAQYQYFANARVVLFDNNGSIIEEKLTGPRGEYSFSVEKGMNYQIAVDAATLTDSKLPPEKTWSSTGGQCADGSGTINTLKQSGYCYGGKRGDIRDRLNDKNTLGSAEHLIRIGADSASHPNLNFGFSHDVVTNTNESGQGSLKNFIDNANNGKGSGKMVLIPAIGPNSNGRWEITPGQPLPELKRANAVINGRVYNLPPAVLDDDCEPGNTPNLRVVTPENRPVFTLGGDRQSVCNTELVSTSKDGVEELIKLTNTGSNATITHNFFNNSQAGRGISVESMGNRISKNRFTNTVINTGVLPIDLGKNEITDTNDGHYGNQPNRGIDHPIINKVTTDGDNLVIEGSLMSAIKSGATVEFYRVKNKDYRYAFSRTVGSKQDENKTKAIYKAGGQTLKKKLFTFTVPVSETGLQPGDSLAAIVIDGNGNTSEFSMTIKASLPEITEPAITLTPEHSKSTAPGLFVHFPHTLTSDSGGLVTLSARWIDDENQTQSWPIKLATMPAGKIEAKRSTEESTDTLELDLTAEKTICFRASFFVPAETPQGVQRSLEITASTVADGETVTLAKVIDHITITDGSSGRLKLQKWVRNKTGTEANSTTNKAGSGDILIYTIQFQNIGAGPLTDLHIMDDTPAFTVLAEAVQCPDIETLPTVLGECHLQLLGGNNTAGFRGRIIWSFDGTLDPGAGGEVSYKLMVE